MLSAEPHQRQAALLKGNHRKRPIGAVCDGEESGLLGSLQRLPSSVERETEITKLKSPVLTIQAAANILSPRPVTIGTAERLWGMAATVRGVARPLSWRIVNRKWLMVLCCPAFACSTQPNINRPPAVLLKWCRPLPSEAGTATSGTHTCEAPALAIPFPCGKARISGTTTPTESTPRHGH